MIVKMIQNLRNRMEARIEKTQEVLNKDIEELKNTQAIVPAHMEYKINYGKNYM